MKLFQIFDQNFLDSFRELKSQRLPLKTSIKLASVSRKIKEEAEILDAVRKDLLESLSEKDDNGKAVIENKQFKLSPEAAVKFSEQLKEVLNTEIDIEKIKVSDLGDISKIELSALDVEALSGVIEY